MDGWIYKRPAKYHFNAWISPDYRKTFTTDVRFEYTGTNESGRDQVQFRISPRVRLSDQFNLKLETEVKYDNNAYGYVDDSINVNDQQVIIFGQRDVQTVTNTLESNYIFNNKSSLSLRLRHYWIKAHYKNYYNLQDDGSLVQNGFIDDNDFNVNAFNIDMVYTWNFAPGSELLLVYKNAIYANIDTSVKNYFSNLRNTFDSPMTNSFSIKILYYLDYLKLKRKIKRG